MNDIIIQRVLVMLLRNYLSFNDQIIDQILKDPTYFVDIKRRNKIVDLEVLLSGNDENPPHFHVRLKEKDIDAKFSIETGRYMSGEIDSRNLKKIKAFYHNEDVNLIMRQMWRKWQGL